MNLKAGDGVIVLMDRLHRDSPYGRGPRGGLMPAEVLDPLPAGAIIKLMPETESMRDFSFYMTRYVQHRVLMRSADGEILRSRSTGEGRGS